MIRVGLLTLSFALAIGTVNLFAATALGQHKAASATREYITTAKHNRLLQDQLSAIKGKEANIVSLVFPPGWVGGRHYHTGDVFLLVQEGQFIVDVEGEGRKTFGPGEVYHEALNKVMQARNASQTKPIKAIMFQVGDTGEPLMIQAK